MTLEEELKKGEVGYKKGSDSSEKWEQIHRYTYQSLTRICSNFTYMSIKSDAHWTQEITIWEKKKK